MMLFKSPTTLLNKKQLPKRYVLPNGFTIVHVETNCQTLFRIELVTRSGMLHEKDCESGFSHFLEHLLAFFPSPEYPDPLLNQQEVTRRGLNVNAFTEENVVGYFAEGLRKYRDEAIHLMMTSFIRCLIPPDVYENEKKSVLRELDGYINDTWYNLDTLVSYIQFNGTSLQHSVRYEKNIVETQCTLEKLETFRKRMYCPQRTTMILNCKDTDKSIRDLVKWIQELYFPTITQTLHPVYIPEIPQRENKFENCKQQYFFIETPDAGDTYRFEVYFPIPFTQFDEKVHVLNFIHSILTNGMGSRLYRALRTHVGGVYYVKSESSFTPLLKDRNWFKIQSETTSVKFLDVHDHLLVELAALCEELHFDQEEIEQYRNTIQSIRDSFVCSHSPFEESAMYRDTIIWGRPFETPEQILQKRQAVLTNTNFIQQVIREVFDSSKMRFFYSGCKPLFDRGLVFKDDEHA